jgi:hypothetical protein
VGKDVTLLREALAACDMPDEGLRAWLDHNEGFCRRHGAERYREWLELYEQCRKLLDDAS